jgi:hypothetical protein
MSSKTSFVRPPRFASWLVNLFTLPDEESLVGDLLEEFFLLASAAGGRFARRWYWKQTMKTVFHLFLGGLRGAPWSTAAAIVGGFLVSKLANELPDKLLSTLTDRYLTYWSGHFHAYLWVLKGLFIAHLTVSLFVGCSVALMAKGREVTATMAMGLILCAMICVSSFWIVAGIGDASFLWNLPWFLADPVAIVMGGVIIRARRSTGAVRQSRA